MSLDFFRQVFLIFPQDWLVPWSILWQDMGKVDARHQHSLEPQIAEKKKMYDRTNAFRTVNTAADTTIHECGLSTQAAWQMTRRAYIDSLIADGEMFGIDGGLPTKLAKTTAKGVRTANGRFVPYDRLSHVYEHRCRVEEAIRKGWSVPAEVLADYPDLAQQTTGKIGLSSDSTAIDSARA